LSLLDDLALPVDYGVTDTVDYAATAAYIIYAVANAAAAVGSG
jgi:hypothetical protein